MCVHRYEHRTKISSVSSPFSVESSTKRNNALRRSVTLEEDAGKEPVKEGKQSRKRAKEVLDEGVEDTCDRGDKVKQHRVTEEEDSTVEDDKGEEEVGEEEQTSYSRQQLVGSSTSNISRINQRFFSVLGPYPSVVQQQEV